MKEFGIGLLLIIWLLVTASLAISIIGWVVLLSSFDGTKSTWMTIGLELSNKLK